MLGNKEVYAYRASQKKQAQFYERWWWWLNDTLYFLVELKPLFLKVFKFQSQRLVMSQTDVYVTADLYHAKQPDKPRLVWLLKKTCCCLSSYLYTSIHCFFAFGANIWNCTWGNEAWYRCPWRNICFKTWTGLVSNIQTVCAWINHAVLCYSCMSLKSYWEISHGWIFCLLSLETRSLTQFSICTGVENQEQWTVNSLLNSTVYK